MAVAAMGLPDRTRSRARRKSCTWDASAEPHAAVAMKQPSTYLKCGAGITNPMNASVDVWPQASAARTPTA